MELSGFCWIDGKSEMKISSPQMMSEPPFQGFLGKHPKMLAAKLMSWGDSSTSLVEGRG